MPSPTPQQVKEARQQAGLTQTKAAELVHSKLRAWQQWEAGDRVMHSGLWELFCIKTEKPVTGPTDAHAAFEMHFQLSSRQAWKTKDGNDYLNKDIQAKWMGWNAAKGEENGL